ncbi:MAG: hypothetical protein GX485_06685 [Clostridiales bacterium]|jgi:uncharacterized Zn finger protein (UPF0148 family)|nr:hypothetical protein [Clostridiales bacterium]
MTYVCADCGFLFYRAGEIENCPACEKSNIRSATEEEAQKLQELLEQENQICGERSKKPLWN